MFRKVLVVAVVILVPALLIAQRTVTRVGIVAKPRVYEGPCPADIEFIATIHVSHYPTFAEYEWERSDGAKGPRQRVEIRSAGRGVTDRWHIGAGRRRYVIWERLHVLAPTGITSPAARVTVNCGR
jgi:hypothetical protein